MLLLHQLKKNRQEIIFGRVLIFYKEGRKIAFTAMSRAST